MSTLTREEVTVRSCLEPVAYDLRAWILDEEFEVGIDGRGTGKKFG